MKIKDCPKNMTYGSFNDVGNTYYHDNTFSYMVHEMHHAIQAVR